MTPEEFALRVVERSDIPEATKPKWLVALAKLYSDNLPTIPPEPIKNSMDHARWRDKLKDWKGADIPAMEDAAVALLLVFKSSFPDYSGDTCMEVSVIETIYNPAKLVEDYMRCILHAFPNTFERYCQNMKDLNNLKPGMKPVMPRDFRGNPYEYLNDTHLLEPLFCNIPFKVPQSPRFRGTWIVGPSGTGKSTLLRSLVADDLWEECSIILMDSKHSGDFIKPFKTAKALQNKLILLEPGALAINPFQLPHTTPQATISF